MKAIQYLSDEIMVEVVGGEPAIRPRPELPTVFASPPEIAQENSPVTFVERPLPAPGG